MIQMILRAIRFAFQNFFRNFWLSIATMTVIIITLIFVNIIIVINEIKISMLSAVERQIDISLDFKQTIPETDILKIKDLLLSDKRIKNVSIVTPDENLDKFKKRYPKIGASIIPALDKNPLGYTLKIQAYNLSDYSMLLKDIENNDAYSSKFENTHFNDYSLFTSKAAALSDKINIGSVSLASIFFVIALIIVFNAIRVSIYTQREEIGIMRLVGASNLFIRMPFLIEAIIYSLVSVAILSIVIFVLLHIMQPIIDRFFADFVDVNLINYYSTFGFKIFFIQFTIVSFVNILSTAFAMRRYLRI